MSKQNAEKLVKALKEDPSLKQRFKDAGPDSFTEISKDLGYECTPEEFSEVVKSSISNVDFTDKASEIAAAGVIITTVTTIF